MIYENEYCKKTKNSHIMIITCAHCKNYIAKYQKVGKGSLINMYVERIVNQSFNINSKDKGLFCPKCNAQLGSKVVVKKNNKTAYKMLKSNFNTKII